MVPLFINSGVSTTREGIFVFLEMLTTVLIAILQISSSLQLTPEIGGLQSIENNVLPYPMISKASGIGTSLSLAAFSVPMANISLVVKMASIEVLSIINFDTYL